MRWLQGAARTAERLTEAASVVVVADRESDIYAGFSRRPASVDMIVCAAQDRVLDDGGRLLAAPEAWPELARNEVRVAPSRTGVPARVAIVARTLERWWFAVRVMAATQRGRNIYPSPWSRRARSTPPAEVHHFCGDY